MVNNNYRSGVEAERRRENVVNYGPKSCTICSKEFSPTSPTSRYCSQECYVIGRRIRQQRTSRLEHNQLRRRLYFQSKKGIEILRSYYWSEKGVAASRRNRYKRRARELLAYVEDVDFDVICNDNQWVCGICGETVDPQLVYPDPRSKSLDHIVPLSRGGKHERTNLQLAHFHCNCVKGARHNG